MANEVYQLTQEELNRIININRGKIHAYWWRRFRQERLLWPEFEFLEDFIEHVTLIERLNGAHS